MKKILALAALLTLAGCQSITPQQWVTLLCGIEVQASEIAALMTKDPSITSIEQAGAIICANNNKPGAARGGVLVVRGVVIHVRVKR